jgi:hypothetical protein
MLLLSVCAVQYAALTKLMFLNLHAVTQEKLDRK